MKSSTCSENGVEKKCDVRSLTTNRLKKEHKQNWGQSYKTGQHLFKDGAASMGKFAQLYAGCFFTPTYA